jgi:AcrR family transcriptional regulator
MADAAPAPRDRMVYSAAQLVRERGVTATGVRDVVDRAAAPRGSFQHYFPGGKDQLVSEALLWSGDFAARWVTSYVDGARRPTPSGLFSHMVAQWKREFGTRGFGRGCPVNAAAADLAGGDSPVNEPLRAALAGWEDAIVAALVRMDVPTRRGRRLATLMLSALEGAILLARVHRDVRPLTTVAAELGPLLDEAHGA